MKRLAQLDNFIFAKRGFLGSVKLEVCTFFMGVVMEVAKLPRLLLCIRLHSNLRSCHDEVVTQSSD